MKQFSSETILESCPEYKDIVLKFSKSPLGIGFATEYPSNVASVFGHTFLIFIEEDIINSTTLNFLADTNKAGFFKTIHHGLTGRFTAKYSSIPFYQLDTVYAGLESRSILIYEIDNESYDFIKIVFSFIEEENKNHSYHFLASNCVTGIKNILKNGLRDEKILKTRLLDYPTYLFHDLEDILTLRYLKSSPDKTLTSIDISSTRRSEIKKHYEKDRVESNNEKEELYIRSLYDFFAYKSKSINEHRRVSEKFIFKENFTNQNPINHKMNLPSRLNFGIADISNNKYFSLRYSFAYKDIVFSNIDSAANNNFQLFDIEAYLRSAKVNISKIKLYDIENNPNYIWPIQKLSWKSSIQYDGVFNLNPSLRNVNFKNFAGYSTSSKLYSVNFLIGPKITYLPLGASSFMTLSHLLRIQLQKNSHKFIIENELDSFNQKYTNWSELSITPTYVYSYKDSSIALLFNYRELFTETTNELKVLYSKNF